MQRADLGFGNESAHLDVRRRQEHDDGFAGPDPLSLPKQCVVNQAGMRRILLHLRQIPVSLRNSLLVLIAAARARSKSCAAAGPLRKSFSWRVKSASERASAARA